MRLSASLVVLALIGAASASQAATVYIFQGNAIPTLPNPPTLSPEQARLVFAQRVGASEHHNLEGASDETLSYINRFGRETEMVFQDPPKEKAAELILVVEGVSPETAGPLLDAWSSLSPAFTISNPPAMSANKLLAQDLNQQSGQRGQSCSLEDAITPSHTTCWMGNSKVIHYDLVDQQSSALERLMTAQRRLIRFSEIKELNVVVVLMPVDSRSSKTSANTYGSYSKERLSVRPRQIAEEPITDSFVSSSPSLSLSSKVVGSLQNSSYTPIRGVPPLCHTTLDACVDSTRNCSGHGQCYKKYGTGDGACFTCGCRATNETFTYAEGTRTGYTYAYWGGSACHKRDVSSAFWLIAVFSVLMVGVISWAIGLLYSIGEEKLPGVIGAGVSSKTR